MNNSTHNQYNSSLEDSDIHSLMNNTFWSPFWLRDESSRLERNNYATQFYYSFLKRRRIHMAKTNSCNKDNVMEPLFVANSTMLVDKENQIEDVFNSTFYDGFSCDKDNVMEPLFDAYSTMLVDPENEMESNSSMNDCCSSSNADNSDADDFNSIMHKTFWSPLWERDNSRRLQRMHYPTEFYYNMTKRRITKDSGFDEHFDKTTDVEK